MPRRNAELRRGTRARPPRPRQAALLALHGGAVPASPFRRRAKGTRMPTATTLTASQSKAKSRRNAELQRATLAFPPGFRLATVLALHGGTVLAPPFKFRRAMGMATPVSSSPTFVSLPLRWSAELRLQHPRPPGFLLAAVLALHGGTVLTKFRREPPTLSAAVPTVLLRGLPLSAFLLSTRRQAFHAIFWP